jgi:transcriptional regulator with XRE-family HTH domain
LRARERKTQQELADMLGVPQSTITRIESGERSIAVSEVFRIAAVLNASPGYLLSGELTGEDISVTPECRLSSVAAFDWITGETRLPSQDEHAFYVQNVSAARARDITQVAARTGKARLSATTEIRASGKVEPG